MNKPPIPPAPSTHQRTRYTLAALAAVAALTVLLRLIRLGPSFNIFIDEVTYVQLARSAADTFRLVLYDRPFYLHPPAYLYTLGGYLELVAPNADLLDQIYAARVLSVICAALSAALLFLIARRYAGWVGGAVVGGLFAWDPFVIRNNSLALLDTPAMLWVLIGYALLVYGLPGDTPVAGTAPFARWRTVAVGVAFGLALLTKDMITGLTVLPLLVCAVLGWALPRRTAALAAGVAALVYSIYPLAVALAGDWASFAAQKTAGLQRVLGGVRITGLNRVGGPSLAERTLMRFDEFGPTYLILALGTLAVLLLLSQRSAAARLLAVWAGCAYLLLIVCGIFGTIEEQFFYWLVVSALPALAAAGALLGERFPTLPRATLRNVIAGLLVLSVGWSTWQWVRVHTTPDNGYEQALDVIAGLPAGQKVAATSETGQFLLLANGRASGPWGRWDDPAALQGERPDYLLVSTLQFTWDQGGAGAALLGWADSNGKLVLRVDGHRDDSILLYNLRSQE
ncbi:MAG TPA: hypothetical protein VFS21_08595 [Roseiflexaceae bacterium]|nr:hypothetical protein [Roseiflexaceae bacterium]